MRKPLLPERRDPDWPIQEPQTLLPGQQCADAQGRLWVRPLPGLLLCITGVASRAAVLNASRAASSGAGEAAPTTKHLFTATRAPLGTDDAGQGYGVGSWWGWDGRLWYCESPATGAAVWFEVEGVAQPLPTASLWTRDDDDALVLTGRLDGHTGAWALAYGTGDVEPGSTTMPDTFWTWDDDGYLVPVEVE